MTSSAARRGRGLLALAAAAGCCLATAARTHPSRARRLSLQQGDSLALSDALETLIASGKDTPADRAYAYAGGARASTADTAATALRARRHHRPRRAGPKGLRAADLVPEVERYARRSRELDPNFRDGAATLLLGTLYVIAPATLLKHGDSETGLELLEEVTAAHPDEPENHLRLAEAYVTLHDPEPAGPHLCFCLEHQAALRADDQQLLKGLLDDAAPLPCAPP